MYRSPPPLADSAPGCPPGADRTPRPRRAPRTALLAWLALAAGATAQADVVSDWNRHAEDSIRTQVGGSPGISYAMVHLAVYDAVNAIGRTHVPYAIIPAAPATGASPEAAAVAAAHRMLVLLFPGREAVLNQARDQSLAAIPDGPAETAGIAVGIEVAQRLHAMREGDGRSGQGSYTVRQGAGEYQPNAPVISPALGAARPFTMTSGLQFRAYGPPDLTSAQYAREFDEVKRLGRLNSFERTAEQTAIARFYFEGPATFWSRNYRNFIRGRALPTAQAARLYALVLTSYADASIACWDSKYYFNFWRPFTAIPAADGDGNPATTADASWVPLAFTPPHPEYPSAHACMTGAMTEAFRLYFGTDKVPMTLDSTTMPGMTRSFTKLSAQVDEVMNARVWGGYHFRSASAAGARLGRDVARQIDRWYFRPVRVRR